MKALKSLITALTALNWFSAPIAIIWLVILGQWWAIGVATMSLFSPFVLGIALLPGIALAVPAAAAADRHARLAVVLGAPTLLYTAALITVWCVGGLVFLVGRAESRSLIPLLLLAYSIGTAPWGYLATKEAQVEGREGSLITVFFTQIGMALTILYLLVARPTSAAPLWWIMGGVMTIEVLFSLLLVQTMAGRRRDRVND